MIIKSSIELVTRLLHDNIKSEVIVGLPDESIPGVYLWPWYVGENTSHRNVSEIKNSKITNQIEGPGVFIKLLIFVTPTLTGDSLSVLDEIRRII